MKKYFYFLLTLAVFTSCEEEVRFNNPAFQTLKDNTFWRAQSYKSGMVTNGIFTVEGTLGYEKITLQFPGPSQQTYVLGIDDKIKATYKSTLPGRETEFMTTEGKGSGQIIVTEYNEAEKTISGTFKFTAVNADSSDEKQEMHFSEGVFYKIPVVLTPEFTVE